MRVVPNNLPYEPYRTPPSSNPCIHYTAECSPLFIGGDGRFHTRSITESVDPAQPPSDSLSMGDVDHLIGLLTFVKKVGWNDAFKDDVLYGRMDAVSHITHSYAEPLLTLRRALDDSKRCMTALNKVRDHLGKKIRSLKRNSTPLVLEDGIRRLPNELLGRIFEMGHLSDWEFSFSLRSSHVSSRFRQVALRTPLLWTRLSARHSNDLMRTFISRSGSLNVHVTYTLDGPKGYDFLKIVGPLSSRWASLSITDADVAMISAAGLTMLPNLRYLSHIFGRSKLDGWSMPLLSHFEGYKHVTQNRQLLDQLTCIDLWFCNDRLDVVAMARVFHKARNLQDLKLAFHDCKPWRASAPLRVGEIPPALSVKINTLNITVSADNPKSMVYNIIQPLQNALSYLLPSQIDICLDHCPFETLYGANGEFFPDGTSIRLDIAGPCSMIDILATLLRRCVIASSVYFKAPKAWFAELLCDRDIWPSSPSIRRVCFRNCDTITEDEVKALANRLLSRGGRVALQLLEFNHCKEISEEFLLNLHDEFGDKLSWTL